MHSYIIYIYIYTIILFNKLDHKNSYNPPKKENLAHAFDIDNVQKNPLGLVYTVDDAGALANGGLIGAVNLPKVGEYPKGSMNYARPTPDTLARSSSSIGSLGGLGQGHTGSFRQDGSYIKQSGSFILPK